MTDKERIRIEVERLKDEAKRNLRLIPNENIVWVQQMTVCDKILYFIDNIPVESKVNDKCPHYDEIYGCAISPQKRCETCQNGNRVAGVDAPKSMTENIADELLKAIEGMNESSAQFDAAMKEMIPKTVDNFAADLMLKHGERYAHYLTKYSNAWPITRWYWKWKMQKAKQKLDNAQNFAGEWIELRKNL